MWKFIVRRTATALLVLVGVSILTYALMFFTPGDPATTILRKQMGGRTPSSMAVQQFRVQHGLNDPIPIQYANWVWDILHGNLRQSYYENTPVSAMIMNRVWPTLELAIAAMAVSLSISLPAGVFSAVHKGKMPDYLSQFAALLGVSMPNFWLGYLLIIVFSLELGVLPVSGVGSFERLILPAVTLGTGMAAIVTRLVRSSMLEVLDDEYIRTARAKGLRERIVVYKHALRNALIPVVTIVGLQFGYLLNGAVVVEIVFQRPGLGSLLINAIFARDYPVVQGLVLLIAAIFVLTNFAVDIVYRYIDPRISFEGASA
ncbi:peptide/nickel transport system permease protein [Haladaptatus litoreus]|uniref:Peptide/nickel transport system permease protein n=1 Tax=Haladaptatus litoreus TaxID=553468 RepID=A0A1N7FCG3_9EURY|nr:nickel ABC transporter permease [Haladaptatus litoreus]SIR97925.1 peptide/nickel transport system permease protein [Haladaptatus litoreus]